MTVHISLPLFKPRKRLYGLPKVGQLLWHQDFKDEMTPLMVLNVRGQRCDLLFQNSVVENVIVEYLTFYFLP